MTVVKDCELTAWQLGSLRMYRSCLVLVLSDAEVKAIEADAGDNANADSDWLAEVEA